MNNNSIPEGRCLRLGFEYEQPRLTSIEFRYNGAYEFARPEFSWTKAVQAFSLLLLEYTICDSPADFFFPENKSDESFAKAIGNNRSDTSFAKKVFVIKKKDGSSASCFGAIIKITTGPAKSPRVRIASKALPQQCIEITHDKRAKLDSKGIRQLLSAVRSSIADADRLNVGCRTKGRSTGVNQITRSQVHTGEMPPLSGRISKPPSPAAPLVVSEDKTGDYESVGREISEFLKAERVARDFEGHFLEILRSPKLRGWERDEVRMLLGEEYQEPEEFASLCLRFPAPPPNKQYWGLRQCSALPVADEENTVSFELVGGTYRHVYALKEAFLHRHTDAPAKALRDKFAPSFIHYPDHAPLYETRLYHQIAAEVLVITCDHKVVLGRRNQKLYHGGLWSATLEEQMLRGDPERAEQKSDTDVFETAHRGVSEELGVTILSERTRLLAVGIAWSMFSALFAMVVYCKESYEDAVRCWIRHASDPYELTALDCLALDTQEIDQALASPLHVPTANCLQKVNDIRREVGWHSSAKARLRLLLGHLKKPSHSFHVSK